jgi:signal transduction histidine kinase
MNVIREQIEGRIDRLWPGDPDRQARARRALGRVLDLELAIMLHTYREDLVARAARNERLATFGQVVGSIGHELRNPLGVIETSVHLLRGPSRDGERARRQLDRIGEQVRLSNEILTGLLDMVSGRPVQREPVAVAALLDAAAASVFRPVAARLAIDAPDGLRISGDAALLTRAVANLVTNALEAAGPEGCVRVAARAVGDRVAIEVEDDGPGIPEAVLGRIFEPLITTKRHGNGLGLAFVKSVAERHGGSVSHAPRADGGTRFTLLVPADRKDPT